MNHPTYERVNIRLRSIFALAGWRGATVHRPDLLAKLSAAVQDDIDRKKFALSVGDCRQFDDGHVFEVANALHEGLHSMELNVYLCTHITDAGLKRLASKMPQQLRELRLTLAFIRG